MAGRGRETDRGFDDDDYGPPRGKQPISNNKGDKSRVKQAQPNPNSEVWVNEILNRIL